MKKEEIKHIANIAMLDFTDEELEAFAGSFSETMDFVNQIREIDTGEDQAFQVNDMDSHLRQDQVGPMLDQDQATRNTASEKYGYFEIIRYVD